MSPGGDSFLLEAALELRCRVMRCELSNGRREEEAGPGKGPGAGSSRPRGGTKQARGRGAVVQRGTGSGRGRGPGRQPLCGLLSSGPGGLTGGEAGRWGAAPRSPPCCDLCSGRPCSGRSHWGFSYPFFSIVSTKGRDRGLQGEWGFTALAAWLSEALGSRLFQRMEFLPRDGRGRLGRLCCEGGRYIGNRGCQI